MVMNVTLEQLKRSGFFAEVVRVINTYNRAIQFMDRLSLPQAVIPPQAQFVEPYSFWHQLFFDIEAGITTGVNLNLVVRVAAELYPGNTNFCGLCETPSANGEEIDLPPTEWQAGSTIYILQSGELPRARTVVDNLRIQRPEIGRVGQIFDSDGRCAINLPDASPKAVQEVAAALARGGFLGPQERPLSVRAVGNSDRDRAYKSLIVEGPDRGRYELNDVPASTAAGDVARAVLGEYNKDFATVDRASMPRAATIDRMDAQGNFHRLDPNARLDDAGVQDGDVLHAAQEQVAGAVDPILREDALSRVLAQVKDYARRENEAGRVFRVRANSDAAPTLYRLTFDAPSWGPPEPSGGPPIPVSHHEVRIDLPPDFPMIAPDVHWLTPIFHPNIHAGNGYVCLGALGEGYRPGLDFAELCSLLVKIASYQNYDLLEGYNAEARAWAISSEGMEAIAVRGGDPFINRLLTSLKDSASSPLDGVRRPAKLNIRRAKL